jgi:hypothetical protein
MKVNELRIGNIVTLDNEKYHPAAKGIPLRITGIKETIGYFEARKYCINLAFLDEEEDGYNQFIEFIRPVPLTYQILLKAGFERTNSGIACNICKKSGEQKFLVICYDDVNYLLIGRGIHQYEINYVHELQNLYYCINKEELDFSLLTKSDLETIKLK